MTIGACQAFLACTVSFDLDALTGNTVGADSSLSEASVLELTDASSDTSNYVAADAGFDALGSRDANGTLEAAAAGPCAGSHVFCDDFDNGGADPSSRWDSVLLGAGPMSLDTLDSVSPSRSLKVSLSSDTGSRATWIAKQITTTKQEVFVNFMMRASGPAAQTFGAISYANIEFFPPPSGVSAHDVTLMQFSGSDIFLDYSHDPDDGKGARTDLLPAVSFGKWQLVTFHIVFGTNSAVSVLLDGQLAGTVTVTRVNLSSIKLTLGVDTAEATTTETVHYDNVIVTE